MLPAPVVAGVTIVLAASLQAPASPPAATPRVPLKIVHQAPVTIPSVQNPDLKPVQVQLDAVVAADGAVSDVRLVSVSIVSPKVEMTTDPAGLRRDFDAVVHLDEQPLRLPVLLDGDRPDTGQRADVGEDLGAHAEDLDLEDMARGDVVLEPRSLATGARGRCGASRCRRQN